MNAPLEKAVHTALDEVRMLMLGTQVLFGFQLENIFEEGFSNLSSVARSADLAGFALIIATLGLLLAAPAQHRLVEKGIATQRIMRVANNFAEGALATFAAALGFDVYAVLEPYYGITFAAIAAITACSVALSAWFGLGYALRAPLKGKEKPMIEHSGRTPLHEKINQMLTEARVILPGAQAVLGFQFIVTMMHAFSVLPHDVQLVHFAAFALNGFAVILLLAPAAVHRLTFGGEDTERMHDIGSLLVTIALVPLALGIAADVYVAVYKVIGAPEACVAMGATAFFLLSLWYGLPFLLRMRQRQTA